MTDHDGPSDDRTRPVRLRKADLPPETERIPTTPETQRFQRPPETESAAPSTYYSPPGQYAPEPQYHQPPQQPHDPMQPQFQQHRPQPHQPLPAYGPPRPMAPAPVYNSAMVATGRPAASGAVVAIAWILALGTFLYLLPWAVAATRNKSNQGGIFVVNFFLGWSFIGWIVALVMACGTDPQSNVVVVNRSSSQHYYG